MRAAVNRDFSPVCYAYAWRVWLSKFVSPLYLAGLAAVAALLGAALLLGWRRRRALAAAPGLPAMFLLGYAGIVYETVLLLAFQALNGSVYWQLGTLFAAFMLGLALGSWLAQRRLTRQGSSSSIWPITKSSAETCLQGCSQAAQTEQWASIS